MSLTCADPLILVGLGLWLESYVAALSAVVPIALMVMRLRLEERFLRRELPGYMDYAARVRFRLIPGVWQGPRISRIDTDTVFGAGWASGRGPRNTDGAQRRDVEALSDRKGPEG